MLWLLIGAGVFVGADYVVERRFGSSGTSGAIGIVLGSVVDGIPESLIFGIGVATGSAVSASFLWAVIVSNVPQALAPSADLAAAGWSRSKLAFMWGTVVIACAMAAGVGYLLGATGYMTGDRMAAFAAGGLLAMLTNSLMPFAFEHGGSGAGFGTVVGFAAAAGTSAHF
jgi:ZIP family zinc transporter